MELAAAKAEAEAKGQVCRLNCSYSSSFLASSVVYSAAFRSDEVPAVTQAATAKIIIHASGCCIHLQY